MIKQQGTYGSIYYRLFGFDNFYCWIADNRKDTLGMKKGWAINCLTLFGWRII